jgi:hypothetical protein
VTQTSLYFSETRFARGSMSETRFAHGSLRTPRGSALETIGSSLAKFEHRPWRIARLIHI